MLIFLEGVIINGGNFASATEGTFFFWGGVISGEGFYFRISRYNYLFSSDYAADTRRRLTHFFFSDVGSFQSESQLPTLLHSLYFY